jgi:hypothetical protein
MSLDVIRDGSQWDTFLWWDLRVTVRATNGYL